jgi:hypothetical protein
VPRLLVGPLLRYADTTSATVFVETDARCEVEILGRRVPTFHVYGHHYALVEVTGLEPGSATPYDVRLDGEVVWPPPESPHPPSLIRLFDERGPRRIAAGSCRVDRPQEPPWTEPTGTAPEAVGHDALRALALRMMSEDEGAWPDLLLLVGDQVYADEGLSPSIQRRIEQRQNREHPDAPRDEVGDFEEFTWLYHDSWSHPDVRWLLSTVPSAMIFDDHDVRDDWNTSHDWRVWITQQPWWPARIHGALMSYWIYQHIGNLSPGELADDGLLHRLYDVADGGPTLREALRHADTQTDHSKPWRWSYCRDIGRTRLVVVDSRSGRILTEHHRAMLDDGEFQWVEDTLTGGMEHLVVVTSLPLLMTPAMHHAETFWSALGDGAWGRPFVGLAERVRRSQDVEHWPAFRPSFERLLTALLRVARGERGEPPLDVVVVSGDVHYSYLADVHDTALCCPVVQVTASPIRNDLPPKMIGLVRLAGRPSIERLTRGLARAAGVPPPPVIWRIVGGPEFGNTMALLTLTDQGTDVAVEQAEEAGGEPVLREVMSVTTAAVRRS